MPPITPLEIYKMLPQTNCSKCVLPSCLAFAAAVVAGSRKISDCPDIAPDALAALEGRSGPPRESRETDDPGFLRRMKEEIRAVDFARIASVIGARHDGRSLVVPSLGKDFRVDRNGELTSECHIISWVQVPLLSYICNQSHEPVSGQWISFREVEGGIDWQGLFINRCEMPLKRLADEDPAFLSDLIDLFDGRKVEWYEADIALVLHPLPHVPVLICYQAAEDDLESHLTIFFDRCCGRNLTIKPLFTLCSGLVQMFAKVADHHL